MLYFPSLQNSLCGGGIGGLANFKTEKINQELFYADSYKDDSHEFTFLNSLLFPLSDPVLNFACIYFVVSFSVYLSAASVPYPTLTFVHKLNYFIGRREEQAVG